MPQFTPSLTTRESEIQSPVVSQSSSRRIDAQLDPILLVGNTQLQQMLGITADVLLKTVIASQPPPLPTPHLSRSSLFSIIARKFDRDRVNAVIGYPECGKTVAIAEFATFYPGEVFWFSAARSETHPNGWLGLFCFSLARFIDAESFLPSEIRSKLVSKEKSLLVVVDNAQHCHDLSALSFLFDAANATRSISILLLGTDEPAFVSAVRSRGIVDWRLPGLTEDEAIALVESTGDKLSSHQLSALEFLRFRVDGHLGMLKLSRDVIRQIKTDEQQKIFISQISSSLGAGLDSLQSAMIQRFREGLSAAQVELCRRLSLVIGSFPRRVGKRVWELDRSKEEFHAPWNSCVVGVFENEQSGRYTLPDLYRDGFRQEVDEAVMKRWHGAIADGFDDAEGNSKDVFDIHASVIHRFLSGNVTRALQSASMYLAFATGPYARQSQAFLIRRFEMWLAGSARDAKVPATERIRWHAIRTRVYGDLNQREKANIAARDLYNLLCIDSSDAAQEAVHLGWVILLMHSSATGQPDLALLAAKKCGESPDLEMEGVLWREFCIISAYLRGQKSPLPYLRTVIRDRAGHLAANSLWSIITGYEFWRAAFATIYSRSRKDETEQQSVEELAKDVDALLRDCLAVGEIEIACLVSCLLVHIHIDLFRDYQKACNISQSMCEIVIKTKDSRVTAYFYDTCGDSYRCAGKDDDAVSFYLQALHLWSDSNISDKAETLLMLGISYAKLKKYDKAAKAAKSAALLHAIPDDDVDRTTSALYSARCMLEAAAFSIHGNNYSKSAYYLIAAHRLLKDDHRDKSEWVALGQIAWALTNRLKPDPINPQPPVPGFTLGLEDKITDAEKMVSSAPTMMLARACAAVGRPHRALHYFEAALAECDTFEIQMQVAIIALDAAVECQDLATATKYSLLGSRWLDHAPLGSPQGGEAFVFDYMVGKTIQLALIHQDDKIALVEIDRALSVLVKPLAQNPATELLASTLTAVRDARSLNDTTTLEGAYQLAITHKALWVARGIAWYWCFRCSIGRSSSESQYFIWHWRLCWLSAEIGRGDPAYLASVVEQERNHWEKIPEPSRSKAVFNVTRVLSETNGNPNIAICRLVTELATNACRLFNVGDVSQEVAVELRISTTTDHLEKPLDALYVRLLDLTLHPGAPHVLSSLKEEIALVLGALDTSEMAASEIQRRFKELEVLALVIDRGEPSGAAFEALRAGCARANELSANSAAQLYIWMRHFVRFSTGDFGFEQINTVLRSVDVAALLKHKDLLPYIRIRLSTCQLSARAFDAQQRLSRAIAMIETQKRMQSPIAVSAIVSSEAARDLALEELKTIVTEFDAIEVEAVDLNLKHERWSCCYERGATRQLAGAVLLKQGREVFAKDSWLKPSISDYRKAIEAAKTMDTSEWIEPAVKAAFSGQTVARVVDDKRALDEFSGLINEIRLNGGHDDLIAEQESLESGDILNLPDAHDGRGVLHSNDEVSIQSFTNHIMESTGWPEDRRAYVEDDVRKMARTEEEQDKYCQYLQPLQNLLHTRSPRTAYTSQTKYTCSCSLLSNETRIEMEDIETVINAMKQVYCEKCTQRKPRQERVAD